MEERKVQFNNCYLGKNLLVSSNTGSNTTLKTVLYFDLYHSNVTMWVKNVFWKGNLLSDKKMNNFTANMKPTVYSFTYYFLNKWTEFMHTVCIN